MPTISCVLRVRKGEEAVMKAALLEVAAHVQDNEPETLDFFLSQDPADPCVFTTYERFVDAAAMDRHNGSETVARFFSIAKPILEGEVVLVTAEEFSAKA